MCGPTRGAVMGALVYEGLAKDEKEAGHWPPPASSTSSPATTTTPSGRWPASFHRRMPVFIVENETFGNTAFGTQNEGLGRVLRYGAYGDDVLRASHWMETVLYPALAAHWNPPRRAPSTCAASSRRRCTWATRCHNRNRAATSLFVRQSRRR